MADCVGVDVQEVSREQVWAPTPGWEGLYETSDMGQVRSVDRVIVMRNGLSRRIRGKLLSPSWASGSDTAPGYLKVTLSKAGAPTTRYVHLLVLEAFRGPRPSPEHEGCHGNGDVEDNTLGNLRWGTRSENAIDRVLHGTDPHAGQDRCLRGHLLIPPNVAWSRSDNGRPARDCIACDYAHNTARRARASGKEIDFSAEADLQYRLIMAGQKVPARRAPTREALLR